MHLFLESPLLLPCIQDLLVRVLRLLEDVGLVPGLKVEVSRLEIIRDLELLDRVKRVQRQEETC